MNHQHWTEQDFIDALYGVGPEPERVEHCDACRARWEQLRRRRLEATRPAEVSNEFLAAQRRAIYRRLGRESHLARRAAPAFVAVLLALIAVLAYRPDVAPQPSPRTEQPVQRAQISDAQLMSDIFSIEQTAEPQAVQAMHALFEEP
jgi:predicted nucleic acid-binding protein